ncbi:MAG: membrane protein insertion efficiency factor YidD [Sumerlaeia bacterium]
MRSYQISLGWAMGGHCRFVPSCSHYGLDALRTKPAPVAVWLICARLLRCQPFCKGGFDPVPAGDRDGWWLLAPATKEKEDQSV